MDKRLKVISYKPLKHPFSGKNKEREEAKAYKKVFSEGDGAKILDALIIDMSYHEYTPPTEPILMAFENGKKYVIHHILRALSAEYTTKEIVDNITLMENNDD
jgi:hypothetical protein